MFDLFEGDLYDDEDEANDQGMAKVKEEELETYFDSGEVAVDNDHQNGNEFHQSSEPVVVVNKNRIWISSPVETTTGKRTTNEKFKPHQCQLCEKAFDRSFDLRRHQLVHSGIRAFRCRICRKAFKTVRDQKRHEQVLHGYSAENRVEREGEGSNEVGQEAELIAADGDSRQEILDDEDYSSVNDNEYRPNSEVAFDQLSGEDFYSYMQKTFFTFRDDPYEQPPASEQPMAARVNEEREYERTEDSTDATEIVDDDSEDYDEEEEEENDEEENLNDGMVEVKLEEMETDCSSTRESVDHHSAEISGGESQQSIEPVVVNHNQNRISSSSSVETAKSTNPHKNPNAKAHQCQQCPKSFDRPSDLRRHELVHTGVRDYHCPNCSKSFKTKSDYSRHQLNVHNTKTAFSATPVIDPPNSYPQCPTCSKPFKTKDDVRKHQVVHSAIKAHQCPTCGKHFGRPSDLRRHLRLVHGKVCPQLQCSICQRPFKHKPDLNIHLQIEHNELPVDGRILQLHQCPHCDRAFPYASKLERHLRMVHKIGELDGSANHLNQVHQCPNCSKVFKLKHDLARHQLTVHTAERPFRCPDSTCTKSFKTKDEVRKHQRAVHKESRDYQCETCGKDFKQKKDLKRHQLVHIDDTPLFQCPLCPTGLKRKHHLLQHLKRTHEQSFDI